MLFKNLAKPSLKIKKKSKKIFAIENIFFELSI
jgi:hypothetical protein